MVAAGEGGRIVNIASASLWGYMVKGGAPYVASKGALLALGRASALELRRTSDHREHRAAGRRGRRRARSVRRGLRPKAPAIACHRWVCREPRDIGAAVLFFATPAACSITNQVIAVDGGWSLT